MLKYIFFFILVLHFKPFSVSGIITVVPLVYIYMFNAICWEFQRDRYMQTSRLTFSGCSDGLGVGHGERHGSHSTVVWGRSQYRGEVAGDLPNTLTTAVRLEVEHKRPEDN